MRKIFIVTVSVIAALALSAAPASAQKKSFSKEEAQEIYERYRKNYPGGLSFYATMQDKPTFKGGGLDNLKTRITTYLDNRAIPYGGSSLYSFVVDKRGKVRDVEVVGPNEKQNMAVGKAIKSTKWKPGTKDGKPVDVLVIYGISLLDN